MKNVYVNKECTPIIITFLKTEHLIWNENEKLDKTKTKFKIQNRVFLINLFVIT